MEPSIRGDICADEDEGCAPGSVADRFEEKLVKERFGIKGRANVVIQKSTPTMCGASSTAAKAHGTIAIHRATYFTRSIASPSA